MATTIVDLKVSGMVAAGDVLKDVITPANGALIVLESFSGNALFTPDSCVELTWVYGHSSEAVDVRWVTYGVVVNENLNEVISGSADAVRKLALVCSNGEATDKLMSGKARIRIIT